MIDNKMMKRILGLMLFGLTSLAFGQINVQAVYRDGQTFVTWTEGIVLPLTYEIYRSDSPITQTSQGVLAGRLFQDEWRGKVLKDGSTALGLGNVTWRVPATGGGNRNIDPDEGLFVNTVRGNGTRYYSVVPEGTTTITPSQQTATPVVEVYDPTNEPVKAHAQYSSTVGGYNLAVMAAWRMGDQNPNNHRPDFPVTANPNKNGMPYIFQITSPIGGPGTAPYPLVLALHGGQGHYWQFRAGNYDGIGTDITQGIMVAPADDLVVNILGAQDHLMTRWFGFAETLDPFTTSHLVDPPAGTIVYNYTQRMLDWMIAWLMKPVTGLNIDSEKISVWGHSAGGRGASQYSRYRSNLISACYMFCPALQASTEGTANRVFGSSAANLDTNIVVNGSAVGIYDVANWDVRLNDNYRDIPFTKIYSGKMEFDNGVGPWNHWNVDRVNMYQRTNDSSYGAHLFWDRRDHGVPDWDDDDPGNAWLDVGEWVTPLTNQRTNRATIVDLQRFKTHQSFPAFFDSDEDSVTIGQQPDPGNGDPFNGTNWGTWCGYIDWDENSIQDSPRLWACTVWLTGLSGRAIDNYPGTTCSASMAIRRPQSFAAKPGRQYRWRVRNASNNAVLQFGIVKADLDGLISISGIILGKDPNRRRIEVTPYTVPTGR
jgi:hypothetical protein